MPIVNLRLACDRKKMQLKCKKTKMKKLKTIGSRNFCVGGAKLGYSPLGLEMEYANHQRNTNLSRIVLKKKILITLFFKQDIAQE